MLHNLRMAEKIVLLLGDIAHEGVTSALSTSGISYKWKFLNSSVENWKSIIRIFQKHDVKMVIGKLTGGVYDNFVSREYADVSPRLLKEIAARPHRLFAYEDLLANKESDNKVEEDEFDRFWRPSVKVMKKANELFRANGLDVLPYRKRAEVTVSAQSFIKEIDEGLLFRLYVPSGRLWGEQMGQLLSMFKDYLIRENLRFDFLNRHAFATVQFVQALLDSLAKLQFVNGVTDGGVGRQFFGHFQENFFGAHGFNLHSIMNNFHSISLDCNNFHERDKGGNGSATSQRERRWVRSHYSRTASRTENISAIFLAMVKTKSTWF